MSTRFALIAGVALTSVPLYLTACGDSPFTPTPAEAAQAGVAEQLVEILAKLDAIEDRLDSLQTSVDSVNGGGLQLSGLPAEQLDSLMNLTSFIAHDMVSGGLELCASVGLAGAFGIESIGEATGHGAGDLGAWAGTGAYAGAEVKGSAEVSFGGAFEVGGGLEGCLPIFVDDPPARPLPTGPARSPQLDQVGTALANLQSQFALDADALTQSLGGIGTVVSSPASLRLSNLDGLLPLPPALASVANDPLGTVTGQAQDLLSSAQSALCSGALGGSIATVVSDACSVINSGGLSNFTAVADIANTYPAVQTAVSNICTRVNSIGVKRLVIQSWDVTILGSTYEVFPGYNQRLFPSYTSVSCP